MSYNYKSINNNQYDIFGNISNTNEEKEQSLKSAASINKGGLVELMLNENATAKDNKNKHSIEKKVEKIAKLKIQIEKIEKEFTLIKELHTELAEKDEIKLNQLKEKYTTSLYDNSLKQGFANWQTELMEQLALGESKELNESGYFSEILSTIQKALFKKINDEMDDDEKEFAKEMFAEFGRDMGVDMDMEAFDFTNFNEKDFIENMQSQFQKQQFEEAKINNEEQQKVKVKDTNKAFHKLYKALVKKKPSRSCNK